MKHPSISGTNIRYKPHLQVGEMVRMPRLFAYQSHDPEMSPRFRVGEIAVFNQEGVAEPGDDVVIQFMDGRVKVRSLVDVDELTVTLRTYFPGAMLVVPRDQIKAMFPVEARRPAREWEKLVGVGGEP